VKYSFMTFSCTALDWDAVLAAAVRYGYDGVEPRAQAQHGHGIETTTTSDERAAIRQKAEAASIAVSCLATSCRYALADEGALDRMMDESRALIRLAGDIGAPCMRVFGGSLPEDMARDDAVRQVADCLASLAPDARAAGVTLCIETHDSWCDARHLARVVERAAHPNVAVNWDIMHPYRADMTIDDAFAAIGAYVRHAHFHDGRLAADGGLCPIGEGDVDHRRAVELLDPSGFSGHMSGEWINWTPWEEHLPRELATMRMYG
jgi:sugar phosphate isomerase/epimerase